MTRRAFRPHPLLAAAFVAAAVALAGCDEGGSSDAPDVDSVLVSVLVDLHLADARAEIADSTLSIGDSLHRVVYEAHSLDSTRLRTRLDALGPDASLALIEAVEERLSSERYGAPTP